MGLLDLLRPELVSDLGERFAIEIRDVVKTLVDRRDFLFGQRKRHFLFPKLIERKVVSRLRFFGQQLLHLLEGLAGEETKRQTQERTPRLLRPKRSNRQEADAAIRGSQEEGSQVAVSERSSHLAAE